MAIPQQDLQHIFNVAAPASYWQGSKGTVVLMFESRHKRAVAQRALASHGIQSIETSLARHHVPEDMLGLQIIWVQISYQVGKVHSDLPTRPQAVGDSLIQNVRAEITHTRPEIPVGYFKIIKDEFGLGKKRVQVNSKQGWEVSEFDADQYEECKDYVKALWKSGLINIDGVYYRTVDEEGEVYTLSLQGGLLHGETYEVFAADLADTEKYLKSEGYVRMTRHKGGSGEEVVETFLIADKMQTVGRQ